MKIINLLLVLIPILINTTYGQITFQNHYGGSEDDGGNCVVQTSEGGYLIAGATSSYGNGYKDIYLIKTNASGYVQWSKTYGGLNWDAANSLKTTSNGCFTLTGVTSSFGSGASDAFIMKIDSLGDSLWLKTYGGPMEEGSFGIDVCSDNGYIIAGYSSSFANGFSAIYYVKTNSNGDTIWSKSIEKEYDNIGYSIIQLSGGGYLLGGSISNGGALSTDGYIMKINNIGDTIWTRILGGTSYDVINAVCEDFDGNYLFCGTTYSFGAGNYDIYVVKTNLNGEEIWTKTYGGSISDRASKIIKTYDNGYAIAGITNSFGAGGNDIYIIKLNNNGDTLWTKTFGGEGDDWATSIQETYDGGFIISGYTNSFVGNNDVYLIKTDANGYSSFEQVLNLNTDCILFPNPCINVLNIKLKSFTEEDIKLAIYNLNGQNVNSYVVNKNNSEFYSINLSNLAKGMYVVEISSGNNHIIKKIIIR